jgi:ribonucleoside-diphosphate reductase alpha chain
MTIKDPFKNKFSRDTFYNKYAQGSNDTWAALAYRLVDDVCGTQDGKLHPIMSQDDRDQLTQYITEMKFIPGGRYLYYAGRPFKAFNNCYLLRGEEDTREEWAGLFHRASSCLLTGGGIGIDYSVFREAGSPLKRTGGRASGPLPLMYAINEIGRNVMQGGSRRSAIYASLNWQHRDIPEFLVAKNWRELIISKEGYSVADAKEYDFNYPARLDMTNISPNYDDAWLNKPDRALDPTFLQNCLQAVSTGEPGFSFNFGDKQNETLRNACTEVTSEDDSDV